MSTITHYTQADMDAAYEAMTNRLLVEAEFTSELVGGMAADDAGIQAFVKHHLKLEGPEAEAAFTRIKAEELGEKERLASEEAELQEKLTYGVSIIRRDEYGPWLGNWMVKACLKAAASRLGLYVSKRGAKGDTVEMGRVRPFGASNRPEVKEPDTRIHLLAPDGVTGATTYFHDFRGRVSTPAGSMSIVSDRECADSGTRFAFEYRWFAGKIGRDEMAQIVAAMCVIGLGSAKAFERGKFRIRTMSIEA